MAIDKLTTASLLDNSVTSPKIAPGAVQVTDIPDGEITMAKLSQVNLDIAPEVLEIQVAAPAAGQDTAWLWTWEQSTLPYARRTITNSNELNVPLYKQGTYVVNNFAAYDLFGSMTQTHSLYLKWIEGAGTENLVSWATSSGPISDSHPDINSGTATDVQRLNISVPATITLPTLTAPNVSYSVTNNGSGAYTFSGSASGDNPNIGPFYRGGTYTFNVSATGHPLYLTTDNGTNFSAGTYFGEYTDGVTGSRTDSGTVTITVPSDAPDTLYYQCGNHSSMRGAITIKDLAVEVNNNGNYVVYFQHTQEGHKTPVELRPIPSLVNQMCLVYDATSGKFVPQDLATYVENTPSFENKIREVAGTAELVVEDGSAVVAKVNVYPDSTYLPLTGNNSGDQAFATDINKLFIWDGSSWQQAGSASTDELTEGSTNLYYTDARVSSYLAANDFDTATNIIASITDSAPTTLDTLNELAAALGDDANFSTTITNSLATKAPLADPVFTGQLTASGPLDANLVTQSTDATTGVKFIDPNGTGHLHYVGASDHFYTTSKLSLGTSANNTPLDVYHATNNTVAWLESGDAGVNITFKDNTTTNRPYIGATGDDIILGHVSGGDKVYVKTSGSVGIGINDPITRLHIHDPAKTIPTTLTTGSGIMTSGADGVLELLSEDDDSTWGHILTFKRYRQDTGALIKGYGFGTFTDTGNQNANEFNRLSLHYGADPYPQNNAELMTWKPNGKVGIGTSDPAGNLHVYGESAKIIVEGGTYTAAQLLDGGTGDPGYLKLYYNGAENVSMGIGANYINSGGGAHTWFTVNGSAGNYSGIKLARGDGSFSSNLNNNFGLLVSDNGLEIGKFTSPGSNSTGRQPYIQIDNSGNVGIGTDNPADRLVVKDTASTGTTIEIQNNSNSAWINNWLSNGNRSNRMELNATQTSDNHMWLAASKVVLGSATGDGNERLVMDGSSIGIGAGSEIASTLDSAVVNIKGINTGDHIKLRALTTGGGQPAEGTGISWTWDNSASWDQEWASIRAILPGSGNAHLTFGTKVSGPTTTTEQMRIWDTGQVSIGSSTHKSTKVTIRTSGEDTIAGSNSHIGLQKDTNYYNVQRVDTSGHFNIDQYGTSGWRDAVRIWSDQETTSLYDQVNVSAGLSHWTDSGTKYYTHLCTLSAYQTTGAIHINTNVPGDDQPGNANMLSFRITGYWYDSFYGGAIDMTVGVYCGEGNNYNTTFTGTFPDAWRGKMYWGQNASNKLTLRLGDFSTVQKCEIAVTDFVQGFGNVNTAYARGWTANIVTSTSLTREDPLYYRDPQGVVVSDGMATSSLSTTASEFTVSTCSAFVPMSAHSKFKIDIHCNVNTSDDDGRGSQNPYRYGRMQYRVNGGTWTDCDHLGISNQGGSQSHVDLSPPRVGTASNGDTYIWQQDRYRTHAKSASIIDTPPINPGDTLQYRLQAYSLASNTFIQIGEPHGYGSDDNYNAQPYGFIVTEILRGGA